VTADSVTVAGFSIGMTAVPALAHEYYGYALVAILISRILDGLDGTLARLTQPTDRGGFLDITLDFIFYSSIVFGFALANPEANALAAACLLACFMGTGSSFLAFAAVAKKRDLLRIDLPHKSLYYIGGLAEGTETIAFFVAICLWPQHFAMLAYVFATVCIITTLTRLYGGYRALSDSNDELAD
ncbi:MAG: CDP-alcohol phosphatidyltransferase family protein, partial [Pseudomonadota bacterium]